VIGADSVAEPLRRLAEQLVDVPLLQFDLGHCPLPTGSVDALIALNVLEHIEDDSRAIGQIFRVLKPGGVAILEVPAGPTLYDAYDKMLLHFRRYSMGGLLALAHLAGFDVEQRTHLASLVYPAFRLAKLRIQRLDVSDSERVRTVIQENISATAASRALDLLLQLEYALGRWIRFPFGIRCVLIARKPRQIRGC
jgi:SAM-dependent methyltransferase